MIHCRQRFLLGACVSFVLAATWVHPAARADETRPYEGYPVVRVAIENEEQLTRLEQISESIWSERVGVGVLDVLMAPDKLSELDRLGLRYKVWIKDVQVLLDHERASRKLVDRGWYDTYKTNDETNTYLDDLVTLYPNLISKYQIGTSIEGRAIYGLTITSPTGGPDKPAICYNGMQHAREWITPMTVIYIVDQLVRTYDSDPTVQMLLDELVFYIVPVVNPDGYSYSWLGDTERMWRKNRRDNGGGIYGVDLNRNWAYQWGGQGSSGDPSSNTYRGTAPFSEPETQAVSNYILAHTDIVGHIDFHSYSQLVLRPWGYDYVDPPEPDFSILKGLGDDMAAAIFDVHGATYVSQPSYALYPASGTCDDWVYGAAGAYSYTFELRDTGTYGFLLPPEQIIPTAEENYAAVLVMAEYFTQALDIDFPDGLPTTITAGADTTIAVRINAVRESVVEGTPRFYYRYDPSGPVIEVPLAWLGVNAYEAVLPATNCTSTPEFYFSADGDGGATVVSPKNAPAEAVYSALVQTDMVAFFEENLSTDPGWTGEDQWAWGQPIGGGGQYGGPDPTSGHTGDNVYGYNLYGDYVNYLPERHLTTSAPIDCTGRHGVHLSFWRWLGVEQPAYDHAYVRVSNNGTDWVTVWRNTTEVTDYSWTLQDIDISAVADNQPTVYLRWTMGTTDGGWRYCGWNIDDIQLSTAVCEGILGDYNGDGEVDGIDFDKFELCFTGPGGPLGAGCGIFDFDTDEDVDCDDWTAFKAAWTSPGDPPYYAPCEGFTAPIADTFVKNRYISFTPGGSIGLPQAFRVTTASNPVFPQTVGYRKWVGPPDGNGVARLLCDPTYRDWGFTPVHVGDRDIVPGATYAIEATLDGVEFLAPVAIATVPVWGDTVGYFDADEQSWEPPNGTVEIVDAVALIDGFKHIETAPPTTWCDIFPGIPDASIDIVDAVFVLDAFKAESYPFDPPTDCP